MIDGKITMHGAPKTPTFVRAGQEPQAGDNALMLEQTITGWRSGDRLILPDTRQLRSNQRGDDYYSTGPKVSVRGLTLATTLSRM